MKVLFVVPRSFNAKQMYLEYPLGVGLLATILRQNGHDTLIYDGNAEESAGEKLADWVKSFQPDMIAYSIVTPNYPTAQAQIKVLKNDYPETLFIAGGVHSSFFPEDLLNDGFDLVCIGEGEARILDIVNAHKTDSGFDHIEGIAYKTKDHISGYIVKPATPIKTDIQSLPMVDRNVFNLDRYSHHSLMASRGCPYKCNFCCNYTGTILQKGLSLSTACKVLDELKYLEQEFNAKEVFFADDIFLIKKKEILKFCDGYQERELKIKWIGQMRADTIDDEIAAAIAKSGCKRIYFGVESGSDAILARVNKKADKQKLLKGINAAKNAGIRVKTGWIFGLPGTLEEQYESIDFMLEMRPHEISVHQLIPFPGTPYYMEPEKHGITILDKKDFKSFCYGGISDNIRFSYLKESELVELFKVTGDKLEAAGYVMSDKAGPNDQYLYSTPLSKKSMTVFRKEAA